MHNSVWETNPGRWPLISLFFLKLDWNIFSFYIAFPYQLYVCAASKLTHYKFLHIFVVCEVYITLMDIQGKNILIIQLTLNMRKCDWVRLKKGEPVRRKWSQIVNQTFLRVIRGVNFTNVLRAAFAPTILCQ